MQEAQEAEAPPLPLCFSSMLAPFLVFTDMLLIFLVNLTGLGFT